MNGIVVHLRAATEWEALGKVNEKWGADAIIGEIRQVRKPGLIGLLGAKEVEVSVRVRPPKPTYDDLDKFKSLVNRMGHNIRAEKNAGYFKQWEVALKEFDIGGDLAGKVLSASRDKPCNAKAIEDALSSVVKVRKDMARVLALVGPTGSGKTTTIAKLAGLNGYQQGKRVAIISLDTFRIGAVEQLRTYTKIMGIPLTVVSSLSEFIEAKEKYSNYDYVYIDTPGKPPGNYLSIGELEPFLTENRGVEVALVVNATTKIDDLTHAHKAYSRLTPSSLIVTRVDETISLGSVATFIHQCGLPLTFIGTGQAVPQDLAIADAMTVAKMIVAAKPYNRRVGVTNVG